MVGTRVVSVGVDACTLGVLLPSSSIEAYARECILLYSRGTRADCVPRRTRVLQAPPREAGSYTCVIQLETPETGDNAPVCTRRTGTCCRAASLGGSAHTNAARQQVGP